MLFKEFLLKPTTLTCGPAASARNKGRMAESYTKKACKVNEILYVPKQKVVEGLPTADKIGEVNSILRFNLQK